jgi:NAD(P)-dependent dehydrogenase (short-subunit alcohol dehydrogenase family)
VTLDFSEHVVLVTGGTRGIGSSIAEHFIDAGATVVVCGRQAPDDPPRTASGQAEFIAADVRDPGSVADLVRFIADRHERLDVVVNNAGGSPWSNAAGASPRFHQKIIDLNLVAPLHVSQAANAVMQTQDSGGTIVNVASVSGTRPSPGTAAYGAAKAGLLNLTQTLAVEWAPKVRVNAVTVGLVRTADSHLHYGDEEGVERVAATVPLGRMAEPADVAGACLYLASPVSSYISGAALTVHGGGEWPSYLSAATTRD